MSARQRYIVAVALTGVLCLSVAVQAATIGFQAEQPDPGPYDVYNFVGATRDANNVGTATIDTWTNNETTYLSDNRPAQGQTFVTPASRPTYLLAGVWIRHVGYTESTDTGTTNNGTWAAIPAGGDFGVRIVDPAASGTGNFVLGSETVTVTREEPGADLMPTSATGTANGTGTWFHFSLDEPVPVAPGKTYGFDVVSLPGGPNAFLELLGIKDDSPDPPGNPYPDGTAYTSGGGGVPNDAVTPAPGDRVFLVELIDAPPAYASVPNPEDRAIAVPHDLVLSWVAGLDAVQHDLYFGPAFAEVDAATTDTPDIYLGRIAEASHTLPRLAPNTTYYWRIDEVAADGTITRGTVWSFTTEPSKAWDPAPYDDEIAVFVDPDPNLSWNNGYASTASNVYFGISPDALVLQTTIEHAEGTEIYTYDVTDLQNGQDYYWRVDEVQVDASVLQGDVWRFTTIPMIPMDDPTLVGWWKFDEGQGKAIDWSGLGQHGRVVGGAESVVGYDGFAIQLDGSNDYVSLPIGETIASLDSATVATWVNVSGGAAWQRILDFGIDPPAGPDAPTVYMYLTPINGAGVPRFAITTASAGGESGLNGTTELSSGWHHMAVTIDAATMSMALYVDGIASATGPTQTLPSDLGNTPDNTLGKPKRWDNLDGLPDPHFNGAMDDFRIYNYPLTAADIASAMRGDLLRAWSPAPAQSAVVDVLRSEPLSWSPGDAAVEHDVYVGLDRQAVDQAEASDATGIYRGRQAQTAYLPPEGYVWGQMYHWRIDEINGDGSITGGQVWTFTVADYLIVDDFESYNNDDNLIYDTWLDGYVNGTSSVAGNLTEPFAEQTIVSSGRQSMPVFYDNFLSPWYSEVEREWATAQDWTQFEVTALRLWIRGQEENAAESLYIGAEDANGNVQIVSHPNADILQVETWEPWDTSLSTFSDAGVSLTDIRKIYLGVGNRTAPEQGLSGTLYVDDIQLRAD